VYNLYSRMLLCTSFVYDRVVVGQLLYVVTNSTLVHRISMAFSRFLIFFKLYVTKTTCHLVQHCLLFVAGVSRES